MRRAGQGRTCLVAAHRGGALLWPENSLFAFGNSVALGVDFLECDVHLSKDGEVVVIHDPTLPRTTTGTGAVRGRTLAELRTLRLRDKDGRATDEIVPTLDDVATLAAPTGIGLLVEIKADARRARYPGIEEKALADLDRRGITARTILTSFEADTIRRVRELRPDVRVGALYSPRTMRGRRASVGSEFERLAKAGILFVGLQHSLVTLEAVALAARTGLLLGAWTVNEADGIRRCTDLGVDVLITDRPDLAKALVHP